MAELLQQFAVRHAQADVVAEEFCDRVRCRIAERQQENGESVDAELEARVATLEEQLVALSSRVRNQRNNVPRWAIQRLEEGQADALGQLLAHGNPSEDELLVDGSEECVTALTTEFGGLNEQRQQCGAAQNRVGVLVAAMQQALDDVTRLKQQISVTNTLPVTTIDSAISTTDKENASAEPQSSWRRIVQLQMMPPIKRARA